MDWIVNAVVATVDQMVNSRNQSPLQRWFIIYLILKYHNIKSGKYGS